MVVNIFCTNKAAYDGVAGVNVGDSVVSVGRSLLRLVWNHLALQEHHYAVKLVPHKCTLLPTKGQSRVAHQRNAMRDAIVLGLWSDRKNLNENTTYTYLGGGTEHHPPYVYSLVFRDVPFAIAYTLTAIVLTLPNGSVNEKLFYSNSEITSRQARSDINADRERENM